MRLNIVLLPAPLGPITPSASPPASASDKRSITLRAPKLLETASRRRRVIWASVPPSAERAPAPGGRASGHRLHLTGCGDLRCSLVGGDDEIVFKSAAAPPLAANERCLRHVLERALAVPSDWTDDRLELGRPHRRQRGVALAWSLAPLYHIGGDLEESVGETDRLCPLLLGRSGIGVGELFRALARQ